MSLRSKLQVVVKFELVNKDTRNELESILLIVENYLSMRGVTLTGSTQNRITGLGRIDGVYEVNGESDDENELP